MAHKIQLNFKNILPVDKSYCWETKLYSTLSCTWEGMVISRWRTGQFVQGKSCRLNEILSFTLHYSINWIYWSENSPKFTY